ncbi:MAG: hypothetical protein LBR34_04950 [Prevotella sp.]|jgi:ketosteroid isomerase-like protein|nr:hypothetical protein [Prevotella sp.]
MKQIYKLAVAAAVCLSSAGQATATEEVVSHVFSDLTAVNSTNYSFTVEGISVNVKTTGSVAYAINGSAISGKTCDGALSVTANSSYVKFQGTTANPLCYIQVTFPASTSSTGIRKVAIWGKSGSGNIDVFYAHSTAASPSSLSDYSDYYIDDAGEPTLFGTTEKCLSVSGSGSLPTGTTGVVFGTSGNTSTDFLSGWGTANVTNGSSKPFQIYAITITAVKNTNTGIEESAVEKTAVSSKYYDLTGKAVPAGTKGFTVKKTIYSDGSVANEKAYIQ